MTLSAGPSAAAGHDPAESSAMTVWQVANIVRRWWAVALLGLLATVAGTHAAVTAPGVYYEEATVVLIAPRLPGSPMAFHLGVSSLVSTAGLVNRQVDPESGGPLALSPKATIVDMGIRDGVWVRLPNEGGQWRTNFNREELDVQVVGENPEEVRSRMASTLDRIRTALREGQLAAGAPEDQLIEMTVTPHTRPILYRRGSSVRAGVAALALGFGLTLTVVLLCDRLVANLRLRVVRLRRQRS